MPAGFQNACHSILVFCGESCIEVAVGQMLLCKGETLPEGLCSGRGPPGLERGRGGGLCLTPLPTTCTVCGSYGNTPVPSANKVLTLAGPHLCCCSSLLI